MLVTGLARAGRFPAARVDAMIAAIGVKDLRKKISFKKVSVGGISGWRAEVRIPHSHEHRSAAVILRTIQKSRMTKCAKALAVRAFKLLGDAEGAIHGIDPRKVEFHEIGGLDSILDVCLAAAMFDRLGCPKLYCSPLPLCDGKIRCAHGALSSPAPATLLLLKQVPVYGIDSEGETVTPTAIAVLKAFGAEFGRWPAVKILDSVRVFGGRILPNVPNGAAFVLGEPLSKKTLKGL
jgi:uncharacterized protein (DUF111 family)